MPNALPASSPSTHWEAIDESLLEYTYNSDQTMYPTPLLTYGRLESWIEACPELCIVLRRGHGEGQPQASSAAAAAAESVLGSIIVVPLLEVYWARLTGEGKSPRSGTSPDEETLMREHDVDPEVMFPPRTGAPGGEKAEVGLHVFHIERFPGFTSGGEEDEKWRRVGFTRLALEEIRGRVAARFPHWSVMGYSALTVTPEGRRAFKRSGFSPTYTSSTPEGEKVEMMIRKGP